METLLEQSTIVAERSVPVTECIEACVLLEDYTSAIRQRALARCGIAGTCAGEQTGTLRPRLCSQDVRTRIDLQVAADNLVHASK